MVALGVVATAIGCVAGPGYVCASDDQCMGDGICEPNGACSFADAECPSGRRYGGLSRPDLAGTCVGGGPADASVDAPPGVRVPGAFEWQAPLQTSFCSVDLDPAERPVLAGSFSGTIDLGGGALTNGAGSGLYVARYSRDGAHEMSRGYGAGGDEFQVDLLVDGDDTINVVGIFRGNGNVGGNSLGAPTVFNTYLASYAATGEHTASEPFVSTENVFTSSASGDRSGRVLISGDTAGDFVFRGVTYPDVGGTDAWVAYVDDDEVFALNVIGSVAGGEAAPAVVYASPTTAYLVGTFNNSLNIGGRTLSTLGSRDMFYARLDLTSNLAVVWVRQAGGAMETGPQISARVDLDGNLVITGPFSGSMSFEGGPILDSAGGTDMFLAKIDADGNHVWSTRYGGTADEIPRGISIGPGNEISMTGEFLAAFDFGGETLPYVGDRDGLVAGLDPDGNPVWWRAWGSAGEDRGLNVITDSTGATYLCAVFRDTVSFGGDPVTGSATDAHSVLVKYQ